MIGELVEQQLRQLLDAEDPLLHRILDIGQAVSDVIRGFHDVGQRMPGARRQVERAAQVVDEGLFGQVETRFLVQVGPRAALLGSRRIGGPHVLEQPSGLGIGQVQALQGHHQADALGVTLEALEVGQHALAQRGISLACRHGAGEKLIERAFEPFADGELAEVAERWIADVVHQAGHFHQAFQRAFEAVQAMVAGAVAQLLVQRANDETTGLLHFQ